MSGSHDNGLVERGGSATVEALLLDLLEWIAASPRSYAEVMDAWRTSCPALPVWEEATRRGFVARHHGAVVSVSLAGAAHLRDHRMRR